MDGKNRLKLFIDFDDTLAQTSRAICLLYNERYRGHEDFKYANPELSKRWDFSDVCPLLKPGEVDQCFSDPEFFDLLALQSDAKRIYELQDKHDVLIVTIGTQGNIALKSRFIDKYLPGINAAYLYQGNHCPMDKSVVNMTGGLLLDDNIKNLHSCNATHRLIFGPEKDYNQSNLYHRVFSFSELIDHLKDIDRNGWA